MDADFMCIFVYLIQYSSSLKFHRFY